MLTTQNTAPVLRLLKQKYTFDGVYTDPVIMQKMQSLGFNLQPIPGKSSWLLREGTNFVTLDSMEDLRGFFE